MTKHKESISVIIPAYNERWRIGVQLAELLDFSKRHPGLITEVVVVDDCSTDRTLERVLMYSERLPITVAQHTVNQGKWMAIRTGLDIAKNDFVLILDADGSASVRELERIGMGYLQKYVFPDKLALFGSRFLSESSVDGKEGFRKFISVAYRYYSRISLRLATGCRAPDDLQCPFKLFPKSELRFPLEEMRWSGDTELAGSLGCQIRDVPVQFHHVRGGAISKSAIFSMAWATFMLVFSIRRRLRKLR